MLAKPLKWLKDKERKPSSYEGTVVENNDPLKLGRVRIRVAQIHGNVGDSEFIPDEDLPWINQRPPAFLGNTPNSGLFAVPDINSRVTVEYPTSDIEFGYYKGGSTSKNTRTTAFDQDYPNSYGFLDAIGNIFRINKVKKTFEYNHPSGNNIRINEDTSIQIVHHTGTYIILNANGTVSMKATELNIDCPTTNITGNVNVGGNVVANDCISSGISGKGHTHGGVMPGGGNTSTPN